MNKNSFIKLLLLAVVITLGFNIFFGRYLMAKISTLPVLNRLHILSPQAPIVINTTHEERISDTGDTLTAANALKSKLSLLIVQKEGQPQVLGGVINLASEGLFLATKNIVGGNPLNTLYIKLDNGTLAQVTDQSADPATNLIVLRAKASSVPVASFGSSEALNPGEKLIFLIPSLSNFNPHFSESFVTASQKDVYGQVAGSDSPSRTFGVQDAMNLSPGEVVANIDGEVVGLWDGKNLISSDVINSALSVYFTKQSFVRPEYGFNYEPLSAAEAQLLNVQPGALVKRASTSMPAVVAGSPAAKAGLMENDIIQAVGNAQVSEDNSLEELLANYNPGDTVSIKVMRGGQTIILSLTPGQLK